MVPAQYLHGVGARTAWPRLNLLKLVPWWGLTRLLGAPARTSASEDDEPTGLNLLRVQGTDVKVAREESWCPDAMGGI